MQQKTPNCPAKTCKQRLITAVLCGIIALQEIERKGIAMTHNFRLCAFADEASPQLAGQTDALTANGIGLIELRGIDGKNVASLTAREAQDVRKRLDASGISVWSIGSPVGKSNIRDDFTAARDEFMRVCETAEITGAKCIRLFSFYGTDGSGSTFDEVCRRLDEFMSSARGCGALLCHENEKKIYGDTPERCRMLLDALPGLSAVFDPANFVQCGADPLAAWKLLGDRVYYAHIKDATADGKNVPAGCGVGCIPELLPLFRDAGIDVLTLEPHLTAFVGLSALEDGEEHHVGGHLQFANNRAAFDHAVSALRGLLEK